MSTVSEMQARYNRLRVTPPGKVAAAESIVLVAMQRRLCEAGFFATAAAVNLASVKLGWEAVRLIEKAEGQVMTKSTTC